MNTPNTKPDPAAVEQLAGTFESDLAGTDLVRTEALEGLQQIRLAKAGHLERQQVRLTNRLGAENPRVLELNGIIASNQRLTGAVTLEVDRARINTVQADERGWILHGYVWNQDRKGQQKLTLALYDRAGRWVRLMGYACTDKKGYFKLSYHQSTEKGTEAMAVAADISPEMFIWVSDHKESVLYRDKRPMSVVMGEVQYREIILGDENGSCQPPSDGSPGKAESSTTARKPRKA
jgi:hypothetical protein